MKAVRLCFPQCRFQVLDESPPWQLWEYFYCVRIILHQCLGTPEPQARCKTAIGSVLQPQQHRVLFKENKLGFVKLYHSMPNSHTNYITMLTVSTDNSQIKDNRLQFTVTDRNVITLEYLEDFLRLSSVH